jgi:hypothetical protein
MHDHFISVEFADGEGETLMVYADEYEVNDGDLVTITFPGCGIAQVGEELVIVVPLNITEVR